MDGDLGSVHPIGRLPGSFKGSSVGRSGGSVYGSVNNLPCDVNPVIDP